jgi:hypothetical protein
MTERNITRNIGHSIGRSKAALVVIALLVFLLIPQSSESQIFPSPCCAILSAGLSSVASAITNVIGSGLSAINATMTSIEAFERTAVWPENLINEARGVVSALQGIFNQIRGLGQTPVLSATLPNTRRLEQTLLSGNSSLINSVDSEYTAVYSAVPPATNASTEVRDLIDMNDAAAQAAMKRAVEIDAIADLEIQAADRILQEVQDAAPGSAPILEAGVAAWLVRANAYTQTALTELMRLRAIDLATAGAEMKLSAQRGAKLRGNVTDVLKRN